MLLLADLFALLLGYVSGVRTLTAPAAVSWAAHLGSLKPAGTPLAFMGSKYTAVRVLTARMPENKLHVIGRCQESERSR